MGSKKLVMKFPFRYHEDYNSQMCLYKLCFNDHFFVAGCKRLKKRVLQHSEEIERKLRLGLKKDDIYEKVINYIQATDCSEFVVHLIFPIALENEIPMYEQRVFDLVKENPLCLNTSFQAQERTYHTQASIYRQLRSEAGIDDEPVDPPAKDVVIKRGGYKMTIPADTTEKLKAFEKGPGSTLANISTTPEEEIPKNNHTQLDSFQEALKRINESYAKDSH